MSFAIIKFSYNKPGDTQATGGICGSGFFIEPSKAISAHHCVNEDTFKPNAGYQHVRVWLITEFGLIRRIFRTNATLLPQIDATLLSFEDPFPSKHVFNYKVDEVIVNKKVFGIGYIGFPQVQANWQKSELVITSANLKSSEIKKSGSITRNILFDISSNDINMHSVKGFELSFGSKQGMSGGPVIDQITGNVLGMLSLGLPPDSPVKTQTFAVKIDEIISLV